MLRIVGQEPHTESDIRSSYFSTASGGILSTDGLSRAERWLIANGWLIRDGPALVASSRCITLPTDELEVPRELVRMTILDAPPTWLSGVVVRGEIRSEFLPSQVEQALGDMFSAEERNALLLAAAEKFDHMALEAIGMVAEELVENACRTLLGELGCHDAARRVRRVSLISDAVGYDIETPNASGMTCRLEVKCYSGRWPKFYITRNEFQVGQVLPRWYLVLCRMKRDACPTIVGWTRIDPIVSRMPTDVDRSARWQSVRVQLNESALRPGLPISTSD